MANEQNLQPFKPGPDPRRNTKGAPHKIPVLKEAITEALKSEDNDQLVEIFKVLVKLAKDGNLKAVEILLDRIYGKPTQQINTPNNSVIIWNEEKTYEGVNISPKVWV